MGGTGQPGGGGVKEEGEGEVVVDEGDGDGDGDGVEVVDPPTHPPPSPSGFSVCHRPEGGADPLVSPSAGAGVRRGPTSFFFPLP